MPSIHPEDLTPFGRAALKADNELAELARLGEKMAKVDVESDGGLDEGIKILERVSKYGQAIAATMQDFASSLQDARDKAEAATRLVAERALVIQQRVKLKEQLEEKLAKLKDDLKTAGQSLSGFKAPKGDLTEDDKKRVAAELERLEAPLIRFIEAAQAIKAECAAANFRQLERQAAAVVDSLQHSRRKINQALTPK